MAKKKSTEPNIVERLLSYFPDPPKKHAAEALGVSRANLDHWERQGYIPEKHALDVERVTDHGIFHTEVLLAAREATKQ